MLTYKGKDFYLDGEKAENLFRRNTLFQNRSRILGGQASEIKGSRL